MSKKLYLLLLNCVFLGVQLNINSMAADDDFELDPEEQMEEVENITPTMRKIQGSLLRIERPADFKEERMGTPERLYILNSEGKQTGISLDIPETNLNLNVPENSLITPVSRPGLEGAKIELADGKSVNILFANVSTLPAETAPQAGNEAAQVAAMQTQFMVEKIQKNIDQLDKVNELLKKYNNDLTLVKNDPEFKEIKPVLQETYMMISSIPVLLSMGGGEIEMLKAKILEDMAKKTDVEGFEDLNQDVRSFTDNIFSFADKSIEFLKKFSTHFTQNKIIKELITD